VWRVRTGQKMRDEVASWRHLLAGAMARCTTTSALIRREIAENIHCEIILLFSCRRSGCCSVWESDGLVRVR
jgi:hypothetical protein